MGDVIYHIPTLDQYAAAGRNGNCVSCKESLALAGISSYPHKHGWEVKDRDGKVHRMWLSLTCINKKCQYQTSLDKLGIPRNIAA